MAPVRWSEALSAMVTQALVPLNDRPLPYFPLVTQVALLSFRLSPVPGASAVVVPAPSLTPQAPTRVFAPDTVTLPPADGVSRFPLSSPARLLMPAVPP